MWQPVGHDQQPLTSEPTQTAFGTLRRWAEGDQTLDSILYDWRGGTAEAWRLIVDVLEGTCHVFPRDIRQGFSEWLYLVGSEAGDDVTDRYHTVLTSFGVRFRFIITRVFLFHC